MTLARVTNLKIEREPKSPRRKRRGKVSKENDKKEWDLYAHSG
jgi:hypothetical protein